MGDVVFCEGVYYGFYFLGWKVFCFTGGMAVAVEAVQVAVLGDAQC